MARIYVKKIRCQESRGFHATVGATAVVRGQLVKYSSGLLVTLAADDKQLDAMVCLANGAVGDSILVIPLVHVDEFEMATTGTFASFVVGTAYGISDGLTLDQAEVTAKLLIVTSLDSDLSTAMVRPYLLAS